MSENLELARKCGAMAIPAAIQTGTEDAPPMVIMNGSLKCLRSITKGGLCRTINMYEGQSKVPYLFLPGNI